MASETVSAGGQFGTDLSGVVDLAVQADPTAAAGARHWLMAPRAQVLDGKPPGAQADRAPTGAEELRAAVVGPSMHQSGLDGDERIPQRPGVDAIPGNSSDPAHQPASRSTLQVRRSKAASRYRSRKRAEATRFISYHCSRSGSGELTASSRSSTWSGRTLSPVTPDSTTSAQAAMGLLRTTLI